MVLSRHSPADAAKARLSDAVSPRTGAGGQPNAEACSPGGEHFLVHRKPIHWSAKAMAKAMAKVVVSIFLSNPVVSIAEESTVAVQPWRFFHLGLPGLPSLIWEMQSLTNGLTYSFFRLVDYITSLVFNIQLKSMFPYLSHITILLQVSLLAKKPHFGRQQKPSPKSGSLTVAIGSPHHCKWLPRPWWVPGRLVVNHLAPRFGWWVRHFIVIQPSKYGDITEIYYK